MSLITREEFDNLKAATLEGLNEELPINTANGEEGEVDHLTFERDLDAETETQYTRNMADYIATYACTGHSALSGEDLQSVLDGLGVPEKYQAAITQTLETGHGIIIREPDPVSPAYMLYGLGRSDGVLAEAAITGIDLERSTLRVETSLPQASMNPGMNMGLTA